MATSDAARIEAAFDREGRALYRFFAVRAGRDAHLADDLMQQLWLHASRGRPPAHDDELPYWLLAIARNLIQAHWRTTARRPKDVPLADPALAAELAERMAREPLPPEVLARREVCDQVMLALTELRGEEQALILAHYFDGRSLAELARDHRLSERAVEGRLYRARQALRRRLTELVN